eukprot:CAMPEP_0115252966 /NCGR_PEP_ID=MMETSP0270-20121206/44425_1 /TAXON_ID=71861 /ORGANISM="Scrippsiella trochoidea, Strain CCMP3099" /LENGTH=235 /DNA_ID=CAMNT_0002668449 /DNA_START=69 /DNA_END=773 /DNA_ORIENTATION=-
MSFSMHYKSPASAFALVAEGRGQPESRAQLVVLHLLHESVSVGLRVALGDMNFSSNLQPFYDVLNLNYYAGVDPLKLQGQQLMDAGRIIFTENARLDLSRSMGFKNSEIYCVAPVTVVSKNVSHADLMTYDFWAVGMNCCSGNAKAADFSCGDYNNPRAHAGLRLMRDDQRAFFRLAVQQAEAAYNIKAVHPLFLHWMQDPMAEVNSYQDNGYRYYLIGIWSHFGIQLFLVVCAT